jgi:hypothetical protein
MTAEATIEAAETAYRKTMHVANRDYDQAIVAAVTAYHHAVADAERSWRHAKLRAWAALTTAKADIAGDHQCAPRS